jgi:hypothetical protein
MPEGAFFLPTAAADSLAKLPECMATDGRGAGFPGTWRRDNSLMCEVDGAENGATCLGGSEPLVIRSLTIHQLLTAAHFALRSVESCSSAPAGFGRGEMMACLSS